MSQLNVPLYTHQSFWVDGNLFSTSQKSALSSRGRPLCLQMVIKYSFGICWREQLEVSFASSLLIRKFVQKGEKLVLCTFLQYLFNLKHSWIPYLQGHSQLNTIIRAASDIHIFSESSIELLIFFMQNETDSAKETNINLHLTLPGVWLLDILQGSGRQGFKICQAEDTIRSYIFEWMLKLLENNSFSSSCILV